MNAHDTYIKGKKPRQMNGGERRRERMTKKGKEKERKQARRTRKKRM